MSDEEDVEFDDRMVIEWEGFITEADGDTIFCRLSDLEKAHQGETTETMEIEKSKFLELLAVSQPDRVKDAEGFPLGLLFFLKVDGHTETATIRLHDPFTAEEMEARKKWAAEFAENMRKVFGDAE